MKITNKLPYEKKKAILGFTFILPWLIGAVFFFVRPFITTLIYSFQDIKLTDQGIVMTYVGFQNYVNAFLTDELFLPTYTGALSGTAFEIPVILLFSLFIALVLNQNFKSRAFYRSIFFLPVIISSGVIISIIQGDSLSSSFLNGQRSSMMFQALSVQELLLKSGISQNIVTTLMYIVNNIFELTWKSGVQILVFIAGLKSIPVHLYEVAKTEGANAWETFWFITFKLLSQIILVNVIYTIIDSFNDYMNPMILYIAKTAANLDIQQSAAMAWMYFMSIFIIIIVVYLIISKNTFSYAEE